MSPITSMATMTGRALARATERVDPSQQGKSLEAGAVSELQGIARFKFQMADSEVRLFTLYESM